MKWQCRVGAGVAALLAGAVAAYSQEIPQPGAMIPQPGAAAPGPTQPRASAGLEAESLPGELTEDIAEPPDFRLGPTPVSEVNLVNFLMDYPFRTTWAGTSTPRSAPAPSMACTSSTSSI
jgi:hypothetical protein